MPNYTTNLNLEKPLQSEQYNVDVFNANADKIDQFAGQTPARALTADKLTTGAKINGVNFKGDADVVTGAGFYYDTVTYGAGDLAFIYNQNNGLELHKSLVAGNVGHNPLTSTGYWGKQDLGGNGGRNVGEIIPSTLPLTDAGLHLLDGTRLSGDGIYKEFVEYIADLYANTQSTWKTYVQPTNPSGITSTGGFSNPSNAFDNNSSTYASCGTTTDYIEWDLGQTLKVSGFNAQTQYISSVARACNVAIYSVDDNNNETLLANGTGVASESSGTSSATFTEVETKKLRFKVIAATGGSAPATNVPSRIVQINIIAKETTKPYFCTEAQWQASVTQYGVCGKFVYDSTNNTVRLPKVTGIVEGTTDLTALGDLVEAGLPNITGTFGTPQIDAVSGAFTGRGTGNSWVVQGPLNYRYVDFNASRTSSVYGASNTVQPQTIKAFYYIVIATSSKTDIQVDIDEVATDLNGKADTDLTNVTDTGYIKMAGASMPSNTYVDLTLGASGSTYTAPADGWLFLSLHSMSTSYSYLNNYTAGTVVGGSIFADITEQRIIPVKKNDLITVVYGSIDSQDKVFRFIYAKGSESEAN